SGGQDHDAARVGLAQQRIEPLDEQQVGMHVCLEGVDPGVERVLGDRLPCAQHGGVGDEDVELGYRSCRSTNGLGLVQVEREHGGVAELACQLFQLGLVPSGQNAASAFARVGLGDGAADAAVGASDQCGS